ncbi:EpsG family protein [Lactobacillus delbrueckii]|uniref:EpsG family protein n=1 Tax=Lactobacillus delbrueckii TaxID=1584 RepID=UPI00237C1BC6|nr:EpsG family protein [Lactobacillus delbrueckii]
MILVILLIILGLLNFLLKRSRFVFTISAILMWTIMAFTYGNADELIYISRYQNTAKWQGSSELLFTAIINICRVIGLNFTQYKSVLSLIYIVLVSTTIWKLSRYPNIVITLFFFYPFVMNVSQLRFGIASAVLIYSYRYLLHDKSLRIGNAKRNITENDIKFVVCVIIASLLHSVAIYWLLLLIPKKTTVRTTTIWMIGINLFVVTAFNPSIANGVLSKLGAGLRMGAYFSSAYQTSTYRHYGGALISTLLIGAIIWLLCLLIRKNECLFRFTDDVEELMKCNIMLLTVVSFILRFTSEMYRPQEALTLMAYIVLTNAITEAEFLRLKIELRNFITQAGIFALVATNFYTKIIMYNCEALWIPIFTNSYLFTHGVS